MFVVRGIAFEREQWNAKVGKLRTEKSENAVTDVFFIFLYIYMTSVLCCAVKWVVGLLSLEKRRFQGDLIDL